MTAVKDVASVEVAAQTTPSDVAADKAVEGGGGEGRRCRQGLGITAEVGFLSTWLRGTPLGGVTSYGYGCWMAALLLLRATPRSVLANCYSEASAALSRGPGLSSLLQMQQAQL